MTANTNIENSTEAIELAPNYKIPLVLIAIATALSFLSLWLGGVIGILGLFLTVQTVLIRLQFTDRSLLVLRSGKILKSFPYSEWSNWKIFWWPVPILFYFREVNSIHFLPIIFDATTLVDCLNKYYPLKDR